MSDSLKVYAAIDDPAMPLRDLPAYARRVERIGFAGLLVPEAVHDGFLTALLALEHTEKLKVATSVVLAFPRSPTTTAYAAWDLQSMSGGRFRLGLGSQIKANVVGRFGVPWTAPVSRMRDYVGALRAVWRCWQSGEKLDFDSGNYRLNRMQPFFNPGPIEHPDIPILLGGVNPKMTELAGETADGLMTHPTNTSPEYLRRVTRPALDLGAQRASRSAASVSILASTFVATGPTPETVEAERERIREFLGFLYSTPQYRRTLEFHGWETLGEELQDLTRQGKWAEMKAAIGDDVLAALVPSGTYDDIAEILKRQYGGVADAVTLRMPEDPGDDDGLAGVIESLGR
jgi:probable F420-dependent oxidoreductase